MKDKEKGKDLWIKCPICGYQNKKIFIDVYGTCRLCNKVLDEKAKFKHEMFIRLRLWRNKKWQDL